jgi:hypothetical protein
MKLRQPRILAVWLLLPVCLGIVPEADVAHAASSDAYNAAIDEARKGHDGRAAAMLLGAAAGLAEDDIWLQRMQTAAMLLDMRSHQETRFRQNMDGGTHLALMKTYIRQRQAPEPSMPWLTGVMGTILPGSGHALLGRWGDAGIAALMVWPMLVLTLWAARRRMGPVTVFFSILTVWLWSGTVFSAVSLAERGDLESYLSWWQGLWQSSGLPGRPW